jgi:hypothetical protein
VLLKASVALENGAGMIEQHLAVWCQGNAVSVAINVPSAGAVLEFADLLADRRLPQTEKAGRRRETTGLCNGGKSLQQIYGQEVHDHHDM